MRQPLIAGLLLAALLGLLCLLPNPSHADVYLYQDGSGYFNMRSANGSGDQKYVAPTAGGLGDISTVEGFPYLDGAGALSWVAPATAPGAGLDLADFLSGNPSVGDTPTWDGTNWVPDVPSSGAAYDDITAPDANSTIAFEGFTNTWTSTLDSGNVFTISNTDADLAADTVLQVLKFTDDGDANAFFQKFFDNAGNDLKFSIDSDGNMFIAGTLTAGTTGATAFTLEGATADDFELTMGVVDPTADRTQKFENADGLVVVTQEVDKTIWQPDLINTTVPILHVDVLKYPYGIKLLGVQITLSADAAYAMVFEEWAGDAPAAQNDIETVTTGAGDAYMEVLGADIDDSDIDADDYLFLHIPATDVPWVAVKVIFYAKTS